MTTSVDQTARDIANSALSAIASHEKVCAERALSAAQWRVGASETMERIETNMSAQFTAVYNRFWWLIGGLIAGCFSIIMLLLTKGSV